MRCPEYAMVMIKSEEEWEAPSEAEREFDALVGRWADLRAQGTIIVSAVLAPPRTARTVSWRGREPLVTDGPYVEAKESVGGFVILDVDSAAKALEIATEALELCSAWPRKVGLRIELRPLVETGNVISDTAHLPAAVEVAEVAVIVIAEMAVVVAAMVVVVPVVSAH
jgi:hypothetical protein